MKNNIKKWWRKISSSDSKPTVDTTAIQQEAREIRELHKSEGAQEEVLRRAKANLEQAKQSSNDTLIMNCAATLAGVISDDAPEELLQEKLSALELVAEKSKALGLACWEIDRDMYLSLKRRLAGEPVEEETPTVQPEISNEKPTSQASGRENDFVFTVPKTSENAILLQAFDEIHALLKSDPQAAYKKAQLTLQQAGALGDKRLLMHNMYLLGKTAEEYRPVPKYEEAIACYQQSAQMAQDLDDKKNYAHRLFDLGHVFGETPHKRHEAIAYYQQAETVVRELGDSLEHRNLHARILMNMGVAFSNLPVERSTSLSHAIDCYQHGLKLINAEEARGLYADLQHNLVSAYCEWPEQSGAILHKALEHLKQAENLRSREEDEYRYAGTQQVLGNVYRDLAKFEPEQREAHLHKAENYYRRALEVWTEESDMAQFAMMKNNLGLLYSDRSKPEEAIPYFEEALRIFQRSDHPGQGVTLNNLGSAHYRIGGEGHLRQAIDCCQRSLLFKVEDTTDYAMTDRNLGQSYVALSRISHEAPLEEAIRCYLRALRVYGREGYQHEYNEAREDLQEALRLLMDDQGGFAAAYQKGFELAAEELSFEQAPEEYLDWLQEQAASYYQEQQFERSIEGQEELLQKSNVYQEPEFRLGLLCSLALLHDEIDNTETAYEYCKEAIELFETRVRRESTLAERFVLDEKISRHSARIYELMIELCLKNGDFELAFEYMERGKSRTLTERLTDQPILPRPDVDKSLREALRELGAQAFSPQEADEDAGPLETDAAQQKEKEEVEQTPEPFAFLFTRAPLLRKLKRGWEETRKQAQERFRTLLWDVKEQDADYANLYDFQPVSRQQLHDKLPADSLLIEWFTGQQGTHIFMLGHPDFPDGTVLTLPELSSAGVSQTLTEEQWLAPYRRYRDRYLEKGYADKAERDRWFAAIDDIGDTLAQQFWSAEDADGNSLAALTESAAPKHLILIPHSGFHLLPLHLIPLDSAKENGETLRLLDRYEISYAPSATALYSQLDRPRDVQPEFLALNPDRSLTFSEMEVDRIAEYFEGKHIPKHEQVLKDSGATRGRLLRLAPKVNMLHLCCHGNFDETNPFDSALLLAGEDGENTLTLKRIFEELELKKTAAVALSSCETGMVKLQAGDEYIGLTGGFLYAGASTVLSTLWGVDDLPTALLMQEWYRLVSSNACGKAEALQQAQRYIKNLTAGELRSIIEPLQLLETIRKHALSTTDREERERLWGLLFNLRYTFSLPDSERPYEHPYFWGAFVCHGHWA